MCFSCRGQEPKANRPCCVTALNWWGLTFYCGMQIVLWRCQWRGGTGHKVGNVVFPVFCPPNSVVHAVPQTLSLCLSHEGNLSPGISWLTAAWRETWIISCQSTGLFFSLFSKKVSFQFFQGLAVTCSPLFQELCHYMVVIVGQCCL